MSSPCTLSAWGLSFDHQSHGRHWLALLGVTKSVASFRALTCTLACAQRLYMQPGLEAGSSSVQKLTRADECCARKFVPKHEEASFVGLRSA